MDEVKKPVNVNMSVELHRRLKVFAAERGVSISAIITELVLRLLDGKITLDGEGNDDV